MNGEQEPIRIVVTIETRIYREGITQLLKNYSDLDVVATASSLVETVEICSTTLPHVLLLDANFPDTLSTIKLLMEEIDNIKNFNLNLLNLDKKFTGLPVSLLY